MYNRDNNNIMAIEEKKEYKMSLFYQLKKLMSQGHHAFHILYKTISNKDILNKILEIKSHFQKNSEYFGYAIFSLQNEKI